jgi:hypothetical protein
MIRKMYGPDGFTVIDEGGDALTALAQDGVTKPVQWDNIVIGLRARIKVLCAALGLPEPVWTRGDVTTLDHPLLRLNVMSDYCYVSHVTDLKSYIDALETVIVNMINPAYTRTTWGWTSIAYKYESDNDEVGGAWDDARSEKYLGYASLAVDRMEFEIGGTVAGPINAAVYLNGNLSNKLGD